MQFPLINDQEVLVLQFEQTSLPVENEQVKHPAKQL
jgi:hypothetical protein